MKKEKEKEKEGRKEKQKEVREEKCHFNTKVTLHFWLLYDGPSSTLGGDVM